MSRAERAKEYFEKGYACSQAVALAFCDVVNVNEETIGKLTLPFGGGFGRLRLVCGAVSGMTVICGLLFAENEISTENKKQVYEIERELCERFERANGSLICAELLDGAAIKPEIGGQAEERTKEYYKKRPCSEIVYEAARILEEYLKEKGKL